MKRAAAAFTRITSAIIGKRSTEKLLIYCAKSLRVNLHVHGLIQMGGLSSHVSEENGESFFLGKILPNLFETSSQLTFFDVGANTGSYSIELRNRFPNAQIYAFEPIKTTYDLLANNMSGFRVDTHNIGLGDKTGTATMFNKMGAANSELATLYGDVLNSVYRNEEEIIPVQFTMDTIDNFCDERQIKNIDFLKIDVEGHELYVLKGASGMLMNKNISFIQFEFNAHNIYSRVYLRDFYLLLADFEFFRLLPNGLFRLGNYRTVNEVFLLQNILAVRKDISHLIKESFLYSPY